MPRAPRHRPRVVVFNEGYHERTEPQVAQRYPDGIGGTIAAAVAEHTDTDVVTVTQDDPEYGDTVAQADVPHPILVETDEMYSEPFDIPAPEELVFISSFSGGEVLRSGACWTRGAGRVFFFSPGDQGYPVYHHPHIRRVIGNAVRWAAPTGPVLPRFADEHAPTDWWSP